MTHQPCPRCGQSFIAATSWTTGCCAYARSLWQASAVIPAADPWKPSRAQVLAAAMAFARTNGAEWMRLPNSSREDFLIDGNAALMAAAAIAPIPAAPDGSVVCMSREHAEAYAELTRATADVDDRLGLFLCDHQTPWLVRLRAAVSRLRALAAPERTTP